MRNKKNPLMNTGLPSLLVIFIVLCLVTFAVLSYVSAVRDYSMAKKTAARTQLYYEADLAANECLTALDAGLRDVYEALPEKKEASFFASCQEKLPDLLENLPELSSAKDAKTQLPGCTVGQDGIIPLCTFYEALNDTQALMVELAVRFPEDDSSPCYEIRKWQTVSVGAWEIDDSLPVLQERP